MGIGCFAYGYFIEPYWIEIKRIPIKTDKLDKSGFRIVHISDLHCNEKTRNEERLIGIVNDSNADIIVFTGDCLMLEKPQALPVFKGTLKSLNAKIGKFAVMGNVDVWYLPGLDYFSETGFELLDENAKKVEKSGEAVFVSGLSCEKPEHYVELLKDIPENIFSIFLYHNSDLVEEMKGLNVDLYLCGHTHGGQVRLPFLGALTTLSKHGKKYETGMYKVGETLLYINRGFGLEGGWTPRVRFLSRPEITIFDITPTKKV
jgi:predicted MPP superfamily phosphohydrolase